MTILEMPGKFERAAGVPCVPGRGVPAYIHIEAESLESSIGNAADPIPKQGAQRTGGGEIVGRAAFG